MASTTARLASLQQETLAPEPFARRALAELEAVLRELALLALADWERLGIAQSELFLAVAGLQRPSWGTWNGLLDSIRRARRAALEKGAPEQRQRVEGATVLAKVLALRDEPLEPGTLSALAPLVELVRGPKKPRMGDALVLPIALRNRIAHDQPREDAFWSKAAEALRPLVALIARRAPTDGVATDSWPAPWFRRAADGKLAAFNGLTHDFGVVYVSEEGGTETTSEASGEVLRAFERLLGKTQGQERDLRKLLEKLAPEELRGVVLGDLLVGRPVGEGGFATVHVGRQLSTGRKVAVKVLSDGASEEDRARFQQEAAFLSRFQNPSIVSVLAYGEDAWSAPKAIPVAKALADEGWFAAFSRSAVKSYIALEWIEGETLEQVFQRTERPDTKTLVLWFLRAAQALAAVHAAGLVHRDVKPSNLMLSSVTGEVKLLDFGIARAQAEERTLRTEHGVVLGTRAYMSPEQLRAKAQESKVGAASDVYSLGATFYELFTGRRLYDHDRETQARVETRKLAGDTPERPRALVRGLSWELETILLGTLEPEVSQRYASAEDVARDLRHYLALEPIEKKRPSLARRGALAYRRNRAIANATLAFVLAAVSGTIAYVRSVGLERDRANAARDEAVFETFRAKVEKAEAELKGLWALRSEVGATDPARVIREAAVVASGALAAVPPRDVARVDSSELPGLERRLRDVMRSSETLASFALGDASSSLRVLGPIFEPDCVAWSPDGKWLVAGGNGGILALWDASTGLPVHILEGHAAWVTECAFSPDGEVVLAAAGDGRLRLWERASGKLIRTIVAHRDVIHRCAFSPDGREFLSASADRTLRLWDRASGALVRTFEGHGGDVLSCAFSPDGSRIASGSLDDTLRIWDRASGALLHAIDHEGWVTACAFSPDGRETLSAAFGKLRRWETATGKLIEEIDAVWRDERISVCVYSPDGRSLLSASTDGRIRIWDRTSGALAATLESSGNIDGCAFSPDGSRIASTGYRTLCLWDRASARLVARFAGPAEAVWAAAFTTDGEGVLASSGPTLVLRERATGKLVRTFGAGTSVVTACAVARDGTEVLAASRDGSLRLWDRESGTLVREFTQERGAPGGKERPGGWVHACAFSPTGREVVSASEDGKLRLWDRAAGSLVRTFEGHTGQVTACAFSPDGETILSASADRTLRLWDRATGQLLQTLEGHTGAVTACAFSPDGTEALSGSQDFTLRLWDVATGRALRKLDAHGLWIRACAFSPDGRDLLSASDDKTLKLWDRASGKLIRTFAGHTLGVTACAFSPDGEVVLSASQDRTIRLWSRLAGREEDPRREAGEARRRRHREGLRLLSRREGGPRRPFGQDAPSPRPRHRAARACLLGLRGERDLLRVLARRHRGPLRVLRPLPAPLGPRDRRAPPLLRGAPAHRHRVRVLARRQGAPLDGRGRDGPPLGPREREARPGVRAAPGLGDRVRLLSRWTRGTRREPGGGRDPALGALERTGHRHAPRLHRADRVRARRRGDAPRRRPLPRRPLRRRDGRGHPHVRRRPFRSLARRPRGPHDHGPRGASLGHGEWTTAPLLRGSREASHRLDLRPGWRRAPLRVGRHDAPALAAPASGADRARRGPRRRGRARAREDPGARPPGARRTFGAPAPRAALSRAPLLRRERPSIERERPEDGREPPRLRDSEPLLLHERDEPPAHVVARRLEAVEDLDREEREPRDDAPRLAPVGDVELAPRREESPRLGEGRALLVGRQVMEDEARDDAIERPRREGRRRGERAHEPELAPLAARLALRDRERLGVGVEPDDLRAGLLDEESERPRPAPEVEDAPTGLESHLLDEERAERPLAHGRADDGVVEAREEREPEGRDEAALRAHEPVAACCFFTARRISFTRAEKLSQLCAASEVMSLGSWSRSSRAFSRRVRPSLRSCFSPALRPAKPER